MPQFSLKRLFVSVTLIAMGIACLLWFQELLFDLRPELGNGGPKYRPWYAYVPLGAGSACITFALVALLIKRAPPE